ncbi:MAG: hypothetical protein WD795_20565 [Woeseia sp.]
MITGGTASKDFLLAAIEAAANIRPDEAGVILVDLTEADDDDIVAAADEAMAGLPGDDEFEFEDDESDERFPVR